MGKEKGEKTPVIVGVGVVVRNENGEVLMLQRKGVHGDGEWALPGGSLEYGEEFGEAAIRELKEETDLIAGNAKIITLSNQTRYLNQGIHYVIIGVEVQVDDLGSIKITEPEKCAAIEWFSLDEIPTDIFEGSEQILQALQGGGSDIKHIK